METIIILLLLLLLLLLGHEYASVASVIRNSSGEKDFGKSLRTICDGSSACVSSKWED